MGIIETDSVEVFSVKEIGDKYLLNGNLRVPKNPSNTDYQAILKWIAMGNTPEPEFTAEEKLLQEREEIAQQSMDELKATNFLCYVDVWEGLTGKEQKQISDFRKKLREALKTGALPDIPNIIKEQVQIERVKR